MKSAYTSRIIELLIDIEEEEKTEIKVSSPEGRLNSPIQARTGDWSWNAEGHQRKHDGPMMNGHPFYNPRPGPIFGITF